MPSEADLRAALDAGLISQEEFNAQLQELASGTTTVDSSTDSNSLFQTRMADSDSIETVPVVSVPQRRSRTV